MTTSIPPGSIDDRDDVVITSPTNGQVLKYNGTNWVNAAESGGGSGDLVLISTATASNSASIEFTGIDNTYNTYLVIVSDLVAVSDSELWMRTSSNNGTSYDSGASDYQFSSVFHYSNNSTLTVFGSTNTRYRIAGSVDNVTTTSSNVETMIFNPSNSSRYTYFKSHVSGTNTASNHYQEYTTGQRSSAGAVDAIQFLMSTGNISSGTFKLYGVT